MSQTEHLTTFEETAMEETFGDARPLDEPVPMSFPAVLRDMGMPRFEVATDSAVLKDKARRVSSRNGKLGKQWIRRKENSQFTANPHIVAPSASDRRLQLPAHRGWPQPLPEYIPRRAEAPHWVPPVSISMEQRLSRKGIRKQLRSSGPYAERLVTTFESELLQWLDSDLVVQPDNQSPPRRRIGTEGTVYEVAHSHAELVWSVPADGFARLVLHAVARFHGLVSFSKDSNAGERLTHILRPRPQVARPGVTSLDTPSASATDIDSGSEVMISDQDAVSDVGLDALTEEEDDGGFVVLGDRNNMESISESIVDISSRTSSPVRAPAEGMIAGQTLDDTTPRPQRYGRANLLQNRLRSGSSPSRSPARRSIRSNRSSRGQPLRMFPSVASKKATNPTSFWEYIYA